ncbi:hypothetical protein K438DRAFT_1775009 [Mycena galopus ATCC 62051]|nr:hypothetical protein K438DRAFT_1775009 [Mycena galopus ATCC 62051]
MRFTASVATALCVLFALTSSVIAQGDVGGGEVDSNHKASSRCWNRLDIVHKPSPPRPPPCHCGPICVKGRCIKQRVVCRAEDRADYKCPLENARRGGDDYGGKGKDDGHEGGGKGGEHGKEGNHGGKEGIMAESLARETEEATDMEMGAKETKERAGMAGEGFLSLPQSSWNVALPGKMERTIMQKVGFILHGEIFGQLGQTKGEKASSFEGKVSRWIVHKP